MENELKQLIENQQKKIDEMYLVMEKIKKYLKITLITTLLFFIIPLIIALIITPILIQKYISIITNI